MVNNRETFIITKKTNTKNENGSSQIISFHYDRMAHIELFDV